MQVLTGVFLFGYFAFAYVTFIRYPPLDTGTIMILFLVGFVMVALLLRGGQKENRSVTVAYVVAALLPSVMAGLFFANGALDHSEQVRHHTVVVERRYGSGLIPDSLVVQSWRSGRTMESVYLSSLPSFHSPFHKGDPITLGVKSGTFGVPWVSSIAHTR